MGYLPSTTIDILEGQEHRKIISEIGKLLMTDEYTTTKLSV